MFDNETIGENIKKRRSELGLTLNELAAAVGVGASTICRYERAEIEKPNVPVLKAIARALGVTEFLMYGEGCPENAFLADLPHTVPIPVIGRVAGGLVCHAEEDVENYEYVQKDIVKSGETYVYLRVIGDSMSPKIMENDLVLVRCQDTVESGEYAVVIIDNEDGVVKKVIKGKNKIELISENPYYPPRIFENGEMERIRIFGKVIESKRKF